MKIRPAYKNDATAISKCVAHAYGHYVERLGKPPGPMLDDYADIIDKHIVYVAELNNSIVGLFVLMENYQPILLDNLAVDPAMQGQGIGTKLLSYAESIVRKKGHDSIQLYTHELMYENIDFYQGKGYQIVHKVTEKGYQRIYMHKKL